MTKKLSIIALIAALPVLSACNTVQRLSEIGEAPRLAPIENPTTQANYQPVTMPMPQANREYHEPNSLWRSGGRGFFRDQRASQVGDILTVIVNIDETAEFTNDTKRSRNNSETAALPAFGGLEGNLSNILPESVNPSSLVDGTTTSRSDGTGSTTREEELSMRIAALIIDVLPNGNLVIEGRQQVRVNYDLRELTISGIIRSEDIKSDNTITHDQIAEARISYGGRGQIMDVQQPRYGQQVFDALFPF